MAKAHIERLAKEKRTVAISETGIDTYRCHTPEEIAKAKKTDAHIVAEAAFRNSMKLFELDS